MSPPSSSFIILVLCVTSLFASSDVPDFGITFPSGEVFKEATDVPTGDEYKDDEETGSKVYKAIVTEDEVTDNKRLSLNVMVGNFRTMDSEYFRAHPTFVTCLQDMWSDLQAQGKRLTLVSGYKPRSKATGSGVEDKFARAGTGAEISYRFDESDKDLPLLATTLLKHCIVTFSAIGRDIGIIMKSDSLFVYMTGTTTPSEQSFTVSGSSDFSSNSNFRTWALTQIDQVSDPTTEPDCSSYTGLTSGQVFPDTVTSAEAVVGKLDTVVTRTTEKDFMRLIQFPSNNVVFEDTESSQSWCGYNGNTCKDCKNGIVGNAVTTRCSDRMMSPRTYKFLNILQKLSRDPSNLNTKVKVTEGWDEATAGSPSGEQPANSLHYEGRMLKLKLQSGSDLTTLSKLAMCAGFDFIKHEGTFLTVATKKQQTVDSDEIDFPDIKLPPVTVPESKESLYDLPSVFSPEEKATYPLIDGDAMENATLASDARLGDFVSSDSEFRYFRLHPSIVECISSLAFYENNGYNSTLPIKLKIVRGFISKFEERALFDPILDERINTHTLGIAVHVSYNTDLTVSGYNETLHTLWKLARSASVICPPLFFSANRMTGIGIYRDGIFIDLRDEYKAWFECDDCEELVPPDTNDQSAFLDEIQERVVQAIRGRMVNPLSPETACLFDDPPKKQDPYFIHVDSEGQRRVKRSTPDPDDCVPSSATVFCDNSAVSRFKVVDELWHEISRKHLLTGKERVKAALEGCLKDCGTCMTGSIWDSKFENCNNLLHWIPFATLNDEPGTITNIYPRDDSEARTHACYQGEHCIDHAPLWSIFFPSMESLYRPEAQKPAKEKIFDKGENPSPVNQILYSIYAYNANGQANVWVRKEGDISSLKEPLKVLFLYNKNITYINVYTLDPYAKRSVTAALEEMLTNWASSGCPANSREYLTPYDTSDPPNGIVKRSVEYDLREEMIAKRSRWEEDILQTDVL